VCGLTLVAPPADAQVRDLQDRTLTADDGTAFVVTSGVVRVPEERAGSGAGARTIDLAVVRIRRGPAPSRTAHVVLAGGPGDSGVNLVLGMARQGGAGLADLIAGDYIGIDQRGTGQSTPNLASTALYGLPLEEAGSPATWLPAMERISKTVAAEFTARGIRLQGYNTRESADDVEDVRRALGYDRITLWGRSYGSHLALAVLRRHPAAIDRLVLIGPEGPNHTWKLPSQVDEVLQRLEEKTGLPQLRGQMREVIAQLARSPAVVDTTHPMTRQPISVTIGAFDLQWITAQALAIRLPWCGKRTPSVRRVGHLESRLPSRRTSAGTHTEACGWESVCSVRKAFGRPPDPRSYRQVPASLLRSGQSPRANHSSKR
jgi:pimeloyl-ACP methyl ester carboxylesterase